MDKIVGAFDPETGQVQVDEQGKLKIQVVVDWPVTAGLSRGTKYTSFFKWAKHFNNYHPEITDETLPLKGYHPLRYQTKSYDERVTSVSKFSHDERQFLENYCRLRRLPEFFKPKELFSALEDNQAQEAEKMLQCFRIKNQTIHFADSSALHAMIPYVQRLLQLFPEIKENTKFALSPNEIRNNVYQIGTKRYLEMFQQSPLDFKSDGSSLRDFLNSNEQKVLQLRMVDVDAWTGLIKVYQVLEKTDHLSEGHYTVLTLEHLLLVNRLVNLNTLLESTTAPHLLMMMCETRYLFNDETRQILRSLFNTLKKNQTVKIILTTQSEDDTVNFLHDLAKETISNGFVTRDEEVTWCDLPTNTRKKLLEKPVNFQSAGISLDELMSAESSAANFLPLGALLEEKELTIADPVPISNDYNESYYIGRTLCYQKTIKQDIFNDKDVRNSHVYLAGTEEEYTNLCQLHPKRNVHWIEKDKSGKLLWQQSQGSLEALRGYIDTDISHTYTPDNLDKLLEQARFQRVMVISDTAGMGKSTVLTHLCKQIKQKFPAKWVVRINLNDHTDALKALKHRQIDKEKAIEFVSEKLLKLKPGLDLELFREGCEKKKKLIIVVMLDCFYEISPFYKETVIDLLQALRQTAVEQLWVTTRPHLRGELEDKLQQLSYTLEPFSEENKIEFLMKFWCLRLWFTEINSKEKKESRNK
jgi:Cdc6-like AAA superfamily ATPase